MKKTDLMNRSRLDNALSAIYDYPLCIIEAPMGFGKTTAVRSFLKSEKRSPLWLTFLHAGEATSLFWEKFTSEIGKVDESAFVRLKHLGFPSDVPQTEKVLAILNDIDFGDKTVLVIDDFHLSPDLSINMLILKMVSEEIDNLHIVIITRDTTNIDFTELLSKGLCNVISQQKLKFTDTEVREFCRMMRGAISETEIRKIIEYTDGWVSLIYMVLLGLENGIPVGMNSSIEELVDRVLFDVYDEHIQSFLLKVSVMDTFTAKQAAFVTQDERANDILKKLYKENAFVYYDQATKTYVIHNVLLDYLRIKQQWNEEELKLLYRRMGEWYFAIDDFITPYSYFGKAGDIELILSHLNEPENIRNELTSFEGSFELFNKAPKELLYKYPLAYLQHILLSIFKGNEAAISDCSAQLDKLNIAYETMKMSTRDIETISLRKY